MHLMIDIETGGTVPGCAIFSIAACLFDAQSDFIHESTFYKEISHSSNMEQGFVFDRTTMDWWSKLGGMPNGNNTILQTLTDFTHWIKSNKPITHYWANSPSFDVAILNYALRHFRMEWPLSFWQERDVRTIKALAWPNGEYKLGNNHNALDDAKNQAICVQNAYQKIGLATNERTSSEQTSILNAFKPRG